MAELTDKGLARVEKLKDYWERLQSTGRQQAPFWKPTSYQYQNLTTKYLLEEVL